MPLARASPANDCFQASKPAAELPHCAASACEDRDARKDGQNKGAEGKGMAEEVHGETIFGCAPEYQACF